jgi:Putative porin
MEFRLPLFLFIATTLLLVEARAQSHAHETESDSIPTVIYSFAESNPQFGNEIQKDSLRYSLDSFPQVHSFRLSTGNLGAPSQELNFRLTVFEPFSVRKDPFSYFGFNRFQKQFYFSNKPYTRLSYFVGQRREQYVDVLHTRNFGANLNFSFHFKRIRSEGFYLRQNTSNTSVRSNLWYKSPGKRYAFMADVYWTGANVAENGGLAKDSVFEFGPSVNRQVHSVNLSQAGNIQRKRGLWAKHIFGFGSITDSIQLDSITKRAVITPAWGISIINELGDEMYQYKDADPISGFYSVIYRDSTETNDSTYLWRLNNAVHLELFNQHGARKFSGFAGVRHEAGEYFQDTIYKHFQNIYGEGQLAWRTDSGTAINLSGSYIIAGTNVSDYSWKINIISPVNYRWLAVDGLALLGAFQSAMRSAEIFYTNYSGNHQRWVNSFVPVSQNVATAGLNYHGNAWLTNLGVAAELINAENYIYLDSNWLPQQFSEKFNISSFKITTAAKFTWFNFHARYSFNLCSNTELIRIPEHVFVSSLFADFHLFKHKLQMQIGTEVTWFSQFTGEGYLPSIAQFHLQNSRSVGNYIYIDPWVSIRIKPVRVFVKAEHVNAGLMGRDYFMLANYPHNDFALKFGMSWLFND